MHQQPQQQVQVHQQQIQIQSPVAATRTQAATAATPAAVAGTTYVTASPATISQQQATSLQASQMVAAIKTEAIKQEVSAAEKTQRDLEDSEYGPNPEGELNAGCRKCNVVFGTAVELKASEV